MLPTEKATSVRRLQRQQQRQLYRAVQCLKPLIMIVSARKGICCYHMTLGHSDRHTLHTSLDPAFAPLL